MNSRCTGGCITLLEITPSPSPHNLNFQKHRAKIRTIYLPEFIVSEKKVGLIIFVALTAHHIPSLTSRNGRSVFTLILIHRQKDERIGTALDTFKQKPLI